jgi:hypothetical protein
MYLCHSLDFEHHIGQDAGGCFILRPHTSHIQKTGYQLEIVFDAVVDLPEQYFFFL